MLVQDLRKNGGAGESTTSSNPQRGESEESSHESEESSNESEESNPESDESSNKSPLPAIVIQDDATKHTAVVAARYTVYDEDQHRSNETATLTSATQPAEVTIDNGNMSKKSLCILKSTLTQV